MPLLRPVHIVSFVETLIECHESGRLGKYDLELLVVPSFPGHEYAWVLPKATQSGLTLLIVQFCGCSFKMLGTFAGVGV